MSNKIIDFEKMSMKYDGILLTEKGEYETRLSQPYNLYGWNVPSLLLFYLEVIDFNSIVKIK